MKRSGFANKPRKPLKRTPLKRVGVLSKSKGLKKSTLKKVSKQPISKLKKKLWTVFSLYIRKRDKNICFICGKKAEGSGYHAGHFISKAIGGLDLYFHEDNVHGCCYNCNINLGGNLYLYGKKLGDEKCDELYKLKNNITKWTEQDYLDKIKYYEEILKRKT